MQEQTLTDIYKNGVDETKCIEGVIKMTWDTKDRRALEALVTTRQHKIQMVFQLCNEYLDVLHDLRPQDQFRLSLRGAKLHKLEAIPKLSTVAMYLQFSDGIDLEWKRPDGCIQNLNTWKDDEEYMQTNENSWYSSPERERSESMPHRAPKRRHDEIQTVDQPKEPPNGAQREKQSNAQKKRQRLEMKEKRLAEEHLKRVTTPSLSSATDQYQHTSQFMSRFSDHDHEPVSAGFEPTLSSSQSFSPKLKAGLRSGTTFYPPLRDVEIGTFVSLIGVVTSISTPNLTHQGDWMRFVQITDPSIQDAIPSFMKINCFTKCHAEWLPTAECGDVVILRQVKVMSFKGSLVGTGYHDRLSWATWSPPGRIHHGPPNKAPREAGLAPGGFGVTFSPFYQPTKEEVLYCVKLSDWWREVQKEEQKHLVHSGFSASPSGMATRRVHRLISEAGPNAPPDGYFDCTVEVIQGFMNESGVYSLYVTDYTRNEQCGIIQSNWCSESLSDVVLRIEMWDAAAEMGPSMKPGELFCIRNARMVPNYHTGFLQGKLQQNKIVRLVETDADTNPYLKALLERKKQREESQPNLDNETEQCLIEDFGLDKFLGCTVEILKAVPDAKEGSFIYVTDYTSNPLLNSVKVNEPWAQGLTGCIIKIFLVEGQKSMAGSVVPGSFCSIRKLRWRYSRVDDCIRVQLGGTDKQITMLNLNNTQNEHLTGLLRRKESWEKNNRRPPVPKQPADDHSQEKERDPACIRIKDIPPPDMGPMRLKVYAKPVSFYPMHLDDAFYQFCSRCKIEIPEKRKACFKCSDFEYEYVEIKYQLYIIIEDEEKEQILISINDTNDIWDELKRVRPRDDDGTARQIRARLSPLLGNLPLVHEYYSSGQTLRKRISFFNFELDSWVGEKGRGFTFHKYS